MIGVLLFLVATGAPDARSVRVGVAGTAGTVTATSARFVRFGEARPILTELAGTLPPELDKLTPAQIEAAWPGWIERRDGEIRARLEQGDEDTIVNWMMF